MSSTHLEQVLRWLPGLLRVHFAKKVGLNPKIESKIAKRSRYDSISKLGIVLTWLGKDERDGSLYQKERVSPAIKTS